MKTLSLIILLTGYILLASNVMAYTTLTPNGSGGFTSESYSDRTGLYEGSTTYEYNNYSNTYTGTYNEGSSNISNK